MRNFLIKNFEAKTSGNWVVANWQPKFSHKKINYKMTGI